MINVFFLAVNVGFKEDNSYGTIPSSSKHIPLDEGVVHKY